MKLYHGTTYENFVSIMQNGFNPSNHVWNCSDESYMYFYNPQKIAEEWDCEEGDSLAITEAFSNARITATFNRSMSDRIIVFEVEVEDCYIEDDDSCPNMYTASQVHIDYLELDNITNIYVSQFAPHISLIYLIGFTDHPFFNNNNFSDIELQILNALKGTYIEESTEYAPLQNWENYINIVA